MQERDELNKAAEKKKTDEVTEDDKEPLVNAKDDAEDNEEAEKHSDPDSDDDVEETTEAEVRI